MSVLRLTLVLLLARAPACGERPKLERLGTGAGEADSYPGCRTRAIGEVLRDGGLKSNAVHPNARGHRVIAERVAEALRASGAI